VSHPESHGEGLYPVWLVVAFGAAVALGALLAPHFSYDRFDNLQYFTPTILQAHLRWLHGHLPLWTSHQNLGEPLLADGQPGVFYPVYTAAVAIVALLGRPGWLMGVVAAFHFALGVLGWFILFEAVGLRRWLAGAAAFSVEGGGFAALIIPLWTFMGGVLCWMPWILYGTLRALRDPDDPRGLWVPAGLLLVAAIGHPQMLAYAWIWILVTAGLFGWAERAAARAWRRWAGLLASGALLSAPVLLPIYLESRVSMRAAELSYANYVARSVAPSELVSLIAPVLRSAHSYMRTSGTLSFYQGSWIILALGAGALSVGAGLVASRTTSPRGARKRASPELLFLCAGASGLLFVLLALGRWGGLMRLFYGIPLWSSFRTPFKFLLFAGASITLAAGLGAEAWLRRLPGSGSGLRLGLALWAVLLVAAADVAGSIGRHPLYSLAFALLFVLAVAALMAADRSLGAMLLMGCAWSGVALVQGFAQVSDISRYDEPIGAFGPSVLGIDPADRVLPVSSDLRLVGMQQMALWDSPSLNGYDGATGTWNPLTPTWLLEFFPSYRAALLPKASYEELLGSRFLKALDVRYAIVPDTDAEAARWVERGGFHLIRRLKQSSVYEQDSVLSRVYFAREVRPYSLARVKEGLMKNRVPVRTAYVDGSAAAALPEARVLSIERQPNGVRAEVDAPAGGLVVFSSTYYPQWRAFADGREVPALRVNGLVTGARIPPGTKTVEFRFGFAGLGISLLLFAAGLSTLALWLVTRRGPRTESPAHGGSTLSERAESGS